MQSDANHESLPWQIEAMTDRVIQWSNINSGTFNVRGLSLLANVIAQAFSELKCEHSVFALEPLAVLNDRGDSESLALGPVLTFRKRPEAPLQILLVGHMDTVFEATHPFQKAYRRDINTLVGPGVADMKGGICVMLEALRAFENTPLADKIGWEVFINPDEEISSIGSAPYLASIAKRHHLGLVFEPAMDNQGTLAAERKGSAKYAIFVRGRAAHVGRDFELGKNAIVLLADMVKTMANLNGKREGLTVNVGYISGGAAVNIVPALALARIDIRYEKPDDEHWIETQLQSMVRSANEQPGFTVMLQGGIGRRPREMTSKAKELYELVSSIGKSLGQEIVWKKSGGCSDANNLSEAGLPSIDSLGVSGGNIHSREEFMLINSLEARTELVFALLRALASNKASLSFFSKNT